MQLPDLDPADRSAIFGVSGYGKSTIARALADRWSRSRAVVNIDPNGDFGLRFLPAGWTARPGITNLSPSGDGCLVALLQCFLLSRKSAPITVICDEAPDYLKRIEDADRRVFNQGRHRGLGTVILAQRPSGVATDVRANCTKTIYLRIQERVDLNIIASFNRDLATDVQHLERGEWRQWPTM